MLDRSFFACPNSTPSFRHKDHCKNLNTCGHANWWPWLLPLHLCHGNNWTCRTTHTTSPQRKRTRREPLSEVHAKQPLEKWQPQSMWQRRHKNQNRINYAKPDETTLSQRVLEQEKQNGNCSTRQHSRKAASAQSPQLGSSCPQCFFQLHGLSLLLRKRNMCGHTDPVHQEKTPLVARFDTFPHHQLELFHFQRQSGTLHLHLGRTLKLQEHHEIPALLLVLCSCLTFSLLCSSHPQHPFQSPKT